MVTEFSIFGPNSAVHTIGVAALGKVAIFNKTEDLRHQVAARGHHVVYRASETNRCPGCGGAQWYVGRMTAECGFCGTAIVLAEAEFSSNPQFQSPGTRGKASAAKAGAEQRRHKRISAKGRTLELLLDGSPYSFALENVSAGGAMGHDPIGLSPGTALQVRFEGGIRVAAVVKWVEGDLVGIAFERTAHA